MIGKFDPVRAKDTARRLQRGIVSVPLFTPTKKQAGDVVISNIGAV